MHDIVLRAGPAGSPGGCSIDFEAFVAGLDEVRSGEARNGFGAARATAKLQPPSVAMALSCTHSALCHCSRTLRPSRTRLHNAALLSLVRA